MERELDSLRLGGVGSADGSAEALRDTIALLKTEQEVLKQE